jgi:hypothetical protein
VLSTCSSVIGANEGDETLWGAPPPPDDAPHLHPSIQSSRIIILRSTSKQSRVLSLGEFRVAAARFWGGGRIGLMWCALAVRLPLHKSLLSRVITHLLDLFVV